MDFEPTLKQVSGDLSGIISQLTQWNQLNEKIASGTARIRSNVRNNGNIGQGIQNMMDSSLAKFSGGGSGGGGGGEGSNILSGSMAAFGVGKIVQGTGQIVSGVNQMMPPTAGVLNRAAGYYNAMSASGSVLARGAVESMTRNSLGKGNLSSESAAVNSAAILMGAGVTAGSKQYKQILSTAGGLTQLTGMSNEAGVSALSGFISGAGSSNLMKNFGIQTSTANGESKSPEQIVREIKARLTAGRGKYTTKDVNDSYAKGALGVTLRNSGLTPDQQQIVLKSLLADATDSKTGPINLDNQKSLKAATDKQGGNPLASAMTVFGAKDEAAQKSEEGTIAGANAAASNLSTLNDIAGELAKSFSGLKAYLDTMQGDPVTAGALNIGKGGFNLGIGIASLFLARGGVVNGPGSSTSDSIPARLSKGEVVLPVSTVQKHQDTVNALLADMSTSTTSAGSPSLTNNSSRNSVVANIRSASFRAAAASKAVGGIKMSMPSRYGSGGDGPAKQGSGGAPTTAAGGALASGVGDNGRISLIPPVNGPLGDEFGNNAPYRNGVKHHGQDWSVSEGTTVVACADGTVVDISWSGQLGKIVRISHGNGYFTRYCHLSNNNIVSTGAQVKQGQQIAVSGNTGSATTGAHLHLELKQNSAYLNPMNFMSGAMASGATTSGGSANASGNAPETSSEFGNVVDTAARRGSTAALPMAQSGSSAVTVSGSGISGSGDALSASINGGYQGGGNTGGGGEGTDPSSTIVKSGHDLSGQIKGNNRSNSGGNNVTINLTIGKATEMEARIFAKKVKAFLEEDNRLTTMGRS